MLVIQKGDGSELSFEVKSFEFGGALSEPYVLRVAVLDVNSQIEPQAYLYLQASLQFVGSGGEPQSISGVITRLDRQEDLVKRKRVYTIQIEPYLSLLFYQNRFKVHANQSYLDIAKSMTEKLSLEFGLRDYAKFKVDMPWLITPLNTFDVEAEDNTLDYFNKILGFTRYYFSEGEGAESLVVIDRPGLLPSRDQTVTFDPSRKEDLKNHAAQFYHLGLSKQASSLSAEPVYFDPQNPQASLAKLHNEDPLIVMTPIYAPIGNYDFIKAKLTEQLNHDAKTYQFKSYYSDLLVGERIQIDSPLAGGCIDGFVESLILKGYYQDEQWRFDSQGVIRPYSEEGSWLGAYQPRKRLPALNPGALLQDEAQVNDAGMYQIKFPKGFDSETETPTVSVREIQETVTSGGGASHSVSGKA
ncbi:MAG: hypothetical protein COV52_05065, partial [Gammaproteobacteria bacterium CG11_big_fil_rev_8_21_14_0_20_46_22]